MPKKLISVKFTVQGRGPFPLDMLRYDRCFPRTETDANIAQGSNELRQVTVLRTNVASYWEPTPGRWASFGWKLVSMEKVED